MSLLTLLYAYFLGGLTFLPLCLVASFYFLRWYLPVFADVADEEEEEDDDLSKFSDKKLKKEYENIKVSEIEESQNSGVNVHRSGWLTVTTEYYEFPQNSSNEKNNEPETNKSAYSTLYKLVKKKSSAIVSGEDKEEDEINIETSNEKTSTNNNNNQKRRKNKYFAVLRHGNLFLYKDEDQTDVLHVIVLSNHVISLWPRDLPDGQLFSKMSAICVLKKDINILAKDNTRSSISRSSEDRLQPPPPPPKDSALFIDYETHNKNITTLDILKNGELPPKSATFYIYADNNCDKEDWYFDLIRATKRPNFIKNENEKDLLEPTVYAKSFHPKTADLINLIQNLHSSEGQLSSRWFNAILGRIYLGLYGTAEFENFIKNKLLLKFQKINKPGYLEEFKVEKVSLGKSAPLLSNPRLTKLTPEGDLEVDASIIYNGGISFQVSTKVNINLGTRFKPRDIGILLAVTFKKIHGDVVFKVKRPPSERIWWGFKTMPLIDIDVQPVVSARQITTGMITRTIENKLKESIKESLVLPSMDDIVFFNTSGEIFRGGIWDKSERPDFREPSVEEEKEEEEIVNHEIVNESPLRGRAESLTESINSNVLMDDNESIEPVKSSNTSIFNFKKDVKEKVSSLKNAATIMAAPKLNKSNSTVKISNDQFLSDGSFIAPESPNRNGVLNRNDENLIDLSEPDNKTVSNSFKKIGKWYFKEGENVENNNESFIESKHGYKAPEMISSRRKIKNKNRERSSSELDSQLDSSLEAVIQNQNQSPIQTNNEKSISNDNFNEKSINNNIPLSITQPYSKIPEMAIPSTRSPAQFMAKGNNTPALPPRRKPPPDN